MRFSINLNLLAWNHNKCSLDIEHFALLSFMLQKQSSPTFQREALYEQKERRLYFWFSPKMIGKELPILTVNMGKRKDKNGKAVEVKDIERAKLDKIRRMVQLLEDEGYIEAHKDNQLLNKALYAFTPKAENVLEYNEEQFKEMESLKKVATSAKIVKTEIRSFAKNLTEVSVRIEEPYGSFHKPLTETSVRSGKIPYGSFRKYYYNIYSNYINSYVYIVNRGEAQKKLIFLKKDETRGNIARICKIYENYTNDKLFAKAKGAELLKLNIPITETYANKQVSKIQITKEYRAYLALQEEMKQKEVAAVQIEKIKQDVIETVEVTQSDLILMCANIITHNTRVEKKENGTLELVVSSEKSTDIYLRNLKMNFKTANKDHVTALAQIVSNWCLGSYLNDLIPDNVESESDKKQWILKNVKSFGSTLRSKMVIFSTNQKKIPVKLVTTVEDVEKHGQMFDFGETQAGQTYNGVIGGILF